MADIYEKKLIGGILSGAVKPSAIDVHPSDLLDLGDCLTVLRGLEAERVPISPEILAARLADSDGFYTASDFALMAQAAPSAAVTFDAANKVKARALRTFLREHISTLAADEDRTGTELLDRLKEIVSKADKDFRTTENNFVSLAEIVPQLSAVYDDLFSGVSYSVPSGNHIIDHEIQDGFSKGDLHVVVGFTGQGKSALALNFARQQAETGLLVGVVSREMSAMENAIRLQSSAQSIPRWQISKGMHDFTHKKLKDGLAELAKLPIAFDTRTSDVESLRIQAQRMVEQSEMAILYVDYLQLMTSSKNKSRAEEVAAVSRSLKLIAMENNIPVVALCQFNRSGVGASTFDLLSHLKESSGIEQDASTVLYVQIEKTETPQDWKKARLQVLKNRNGKTFNPIEMHYHGPTFTFHNEKPFDAD